MKATVGLYRDAVTSTTIRDGDKEIHVKPGQRLMVDLASTPSLVLMWYGSKHVSDHGLHGRERIPRTRKG